MDKAILVHVDLAASHSAEGRQEFHELALAAGLKVVATINCARRHPNVTFLVGSGKVEEIRMALVASCANLVIFNHTLTAPQERNLTDQLAVRVLDRTGLILDIFAQRARTFEGKLQVELAQLEYLSTRLVRNWTHLERQKGGIGLRGGPGETQLETDRRLLRRRIKTLKGRLEKVRTQRAQNRLSRQRKPVLTISLVGYTNAGKSTLFNALTHAQVAVANQLFVTLDPTLRRLEWPAINTVVFADTVGFIRDLPHGLIDAFHATLQETCEADLLLHVIDMAHPQRDENILQVEQVLREIGADKVPQLRVYNKIDLVPQMTPRIDYDAQQLPQAVYVAAQTGLGLDTLKSAIIEYLSRDYLTVKLVLPPVEAKLRAVLYRHKAVLQESLDEAGHWSLTVRLARADYAKIFSESCIMPQ